MKNNAGVWIDHKKAVIVNFVGDVEETHTVESGVEKHVRYSGGVPEDQQENRFTNHLKEYYSKIITLLHDAEAVFIIGPGEAKTEFEKRLIAESLGHRIVGIETVDKMTDREIAAKVREHFLAAAVESRYGKKATA